MVALQFQTHAFASTSNWFWGQNHVEQNRVEHLKSKHPLSYTIKNYRYDK